MQLKTFCQYVFPVLSLVGSVALAGCGMGDTLAPTSAPQVTISGGLQGNNYGGHAPIVGAKVFLLQASTSGYGTKSTSLLTSATGNPDTTLVGTTGNPAYYVTSDASGGFSISGDYTCTAGLPVYLYAIGGSPDVNPAVGYSYISSATGNGTSVTFTVDEERFYVGQTVTIAGIPAGNPFVSLNGTQTVTAVSTTDNKSFSVASTISGTSTAFTTYSSVSPVSAQNPAIVNVAVLGNCPSTAPYTFGTGSTDQINYVYMNEVSTVAAMFALAPFAETSTISGGVVTRTGTDAQHIGIPSGDSLALTGIQNAANNAGLLYDITGGNNNTSSTDGDAHVARTYVPNSGTQGSGQYASVPNALINTLGNILAACVDSANTYGTGFTTGTASPACRQLFENATSNGIPVSSLGATTPTDTATAAINIAHYPAGNGASAGAFVSNIFNIPTGVVPFSPNLGTSTPNDFVIGLNITDNRGSGVFLGTGAKPNWIAIDGNGNAFVTTTGCTVGCTIQFPPTLLPDSNISYTPGGTGVAVDPSGKVWVVNASQTGPGTTGGPTGAFYTSSVPIATDSFTGYGTYNSTFPVGTVNIAIDGNGVAYVSDSANTYIHKITALGTAPAFTQYLMTGEVGDISGQLNCEQDVLGIAVDSKASGYNVWTVNNANTATQGVCVVTNVAALPATTATSPVNTAVVLSQIGPTYNTGWLAIDANGSAWDTNDSSGNQTGVEFGATFTGLLFNGNYGFAMGGGLNGDLGVAVDGNDNVWYSNSTGNSVTVFKNLGTAANNGGAYSTVGSAITPSTGYTAGGTMSAPTAIAIDPSGDVWVINTGTLGTEGYSVTELIGVAAPTYAPLSSAALNNKIGAKP